MSTLEPSIGPSSSLVTALRLLRERWWVLLLCLLLGAAAFVANDSRKDKQFEATATLLFGTTGANVGGLLNPGASNPSADPQRDQSTTLLLVGSSSVADRVKKRLKYPGPSSVLGDAVTASARADANLIDVTASDPDPARAAQLANAFAAEYQSFRRDTDRAGLRQGIESVSRQYNTTPTAAVFQRQTLRNAITSLRTTEATTTGGVQLVDQATEPTDAASPRPKRDAVLGGILGLALGGVLLFGIDLFDRRLKSVEEVETAYQQTTLVAIPERGDEPRDDAEQQAVMEPFRILRVSLGQASSREHPHVVLVTSAVAAEGKSTVAAGLARAVAYSGQHVALVELDLRRPSFQRNIELPPGHRGLASVLQEEATLDDVLIRGQPDLPTLDILAAGGMPARSAELISGPSMTRTLAELSARFDVVILDCPPLLPVADTHALLDAAEVDTVVVVARAYATTRDQAARSRTILLQHGRSRHGLVINGLRGGQETYNYEYSSS